MKLAISAPHALYVRGARGAPVPPHLDEVDEGRRVVDRVAALLRAAGHTVSTWADNTSRTQSANINAIVAWHNKQSRDRDISIHFNAFSQTTAARGCEVWWVTAQNQQLATNVSAAIASAGGFINRGAKQSKNLGFLNRTAKPAVLLEVCFVDSTADCNLYRQPARFEAICRAVAESCAGIKLPSVEAPAPPPPPVEPGPPSGLNRVDLDLRITGEATVIVNGDVIGNVPNSKNRIDLTLAHAGDIIVNINGEDFQLEPPGGEPPPAPPTTRPTIRNGSRGIHVVTLQQALSLTADGIFGPMTETAARNFQRAQGLGSDGIVGPLTWAALERVHNIGPFEPAPALLTVAEIQRINTMAAGHAIGRYTWRDRGRAPLGFVKGMAISYACAMREFYNRHPAFLEMAKANTGNDDRDAMSWLDEQFRAAGLRNDVAGLDTLRHLYVLLMGMGMRESTGKYCVGLHVAAGNVTAETAEAGAWQTSWNARQGSLQIILELFDAYAAGAEGYVDIFKEGVNCTAGDWQSYGIGDGLRFQNMSKNQPRFACEVAGLAARNLRKHYGPIERREVEIRTEANEMFLQVQDLLEQPTA